MRVMPETRDPDAGTEVDWWGMATIGAAIFCLTYGLVEANNRGWGSPLIVTLLAGSAVLAVGFALTHPAMPRPGLQAAGGSTSRRRSASAFSTLASHVASVAGATTMASGSTSCSLARPALGKGCAGSSTKSTASSLAQP